MSTVSVSADDTPASAVGKRVWGVAAATLIVGAAVFGAAFWREITQAVAVWLDSTAYGHCFLILPISAFLVWERRKALIARIPEPSLLPVAAMIPVGLVWLFAYRLGIMEGRQLMAMSLLQLFLLGVLGFRTWRVIAFASLYLYFLVPAGAFMVPVLQQIAAKFAVVGVSMLGIPIYADNLNIEVPGARFVVAEACAGLRFLIAAVAVGTIYGYMIYRSVWRRVAFVAVSLIVPIFANGLRVIGIVVLGYILGSAQAATADHIIYGWGFFSFVLLLLFLVGLPFRQPPVSFPVVPADQAVSPRSSPVHVMAIGGAAMIVIGLLVSPWVADGPVDGVMDGAAQALKHTLGR